MDYSEETALLLIRFFFAEISMEFNSLFCRKSKLGSRWCFLQYLTCKCLDLASVIKRESGKQIIVLINIQKKERMIVKYRVYQFRYFQNNI